MKLIITVLLGSMLSLVFCTKDSPTQASQNPANEGTVKGRIVDSTGTYSGSTTVGVEGTNILATTDSIGNYVLYGVPAGNYTLSILYSLDYRVDITVAPNETTYAKDIVIHHNTSITTSVFLGSWSVGNFTLQDHNRMTFQNVSISPYVKKGFQQAVFLEADSVYIGFTVDSYRYDSIGRQIMFDTCVTIAKNNALFYAKNTEKNRVATDKIGLSGIDTFVVTVANDTAYKFCIVSSKAVANTYVNITTGRAQFDSSSYYGNQFYVVSNSKPQFITLSNVSGDSVDFDIYFVNDQKHDTCYWGNKNPSWSAHGDANNDPEFSGDNYSPWNSAPYYSDNISCMSLQDGAYSLYVKYHDQNKDVISVVPNLLIEIGWSPNIYKLDQFYQLSPPANFKKGDTWYAGKLTVPQRTVDTTGARIL